MDAEIELWMRTRKGSGFGEAGARNHNTGGIDESCRQGLKACGIDRVGHANVVGMNNEKPRIRTVAEPFG